MGVPPQLATAVHAPHAVFVVAVHAALCQVPAAHTVHAVHVRPLPYVPALHAQVRLPVVFVHVALPLQPPLAVWHSFTSVAVVVPSQV